MASYTDIFRKVAIRTSIFVGSPTHFSIWVLLILLWFFSGFFCNFNTEWNFWANTSTTVFTFLICLLLQNTQNRDTKVLQLKLDEIIRAIKGARNKLVDLENLSDQDLKKLEKEFKNIRQKAEKAE